ncbi:hypothetical protein AKJ16_DCAP12055 [Drosera capensis]
MVASVSNSKLLVVLLYGLLIMGPVKRSWGAEACPLICRDLEYATCPSSGTKELSASCSCCLSGLTGSGCTLHFSDGTTETC